MFERFSKIINNVDSLGKPYQEGDIVRKVLRSLTPEWKSKMNAIQEAHDTNVMTYDQFRENLITHEITHLNKSRRVDEKKKISLKATTSSKKSAKATKLVEEDDSEESSSSEDEEEFGLLVRRFQKFLKRQKRRKDKKKGPPKWYGCGEVRHFKPNCPKAQIEQE